MRSTETAISKLFLPIAMITALALAGCWTKKANEIMTPDPVKPSGFVKGPGEMQDTHGLAYQRAWARPGVWFDQYQTIQVAPVDVTHLLALKGWAEASLKADDVKVEAEKLAAAMKQKFEKALSEQPNARLKVVQEPGADTVVLQMAIVELVPSKVWLGSVGLASWALGPVGIATGTVAATANQASMAFEGRVRDGTTQSIWGMFADNENAKTRPLNVKAVTWYGHADEIMDAWAKEFAAIANGPPEVKVKDDSFFTLKPW